MARTLSSGNNLSHAAAVLTAVPFTMACWFKLTTLAPAAQTLISIDAGDNVNRFMMDVTSAGRVRAHVTAANQSNAASSAVSSTADVGNWHHACAVQATATSRDAYLNGGNKGSNTTSRTPIGLDTTLIGLFSGPGNPVTDGDIAEAAIWNVALSDAEVALLATGIGPYAVQRANLVAYWPLLGQASPEPDKAGSFSMTLTGTPPQAAHPFIFYGKNRFQRRGLLTS